MTITLHRSRPLLGDIRIPRDKSITHRALLCGALADGVSRIDRWLDAEDPGSTINCLRGLGVSIESDRGALVIHGRTDRRLTRPENPLNAGNSGTTIRLLSGILAGQEFVSEIGGDQYLNRRPMKRIAEPLTQMGATIETTPSGTAPLRIAGKRPLRGMTYSLPVASAQVKSAILLAGLFADGETTVIESRPSRDHTERMLGLVPVKVGDDRRITITSSLTIPAREYSVPCDISSALFFVAAALLVPGSDIRMEDVGLNPTRTAALTILQSLGGAVAIADKRESAGEPVGTVHVRHSALSGRCSITAGMVPFLIDEIPVLAVTAACARIPFVVRGASELRAKESDRIYFLVRNLRAMGLEVEEYDDGFAFEGKNTVFPASIETGGDHRIAMAFGIAACTLRKGMTIPNAESAEISFPGFWTILQQYQS